MVCYIESRLTDVTLREIKYLKVTETSQGKGRVKKIWILTIKDDLKTPILICKIALDWSEQKCKIHLVDPSVIKCNDD